LKKLLTNELYKISKQISLHAVLDVSVVSVDLGMFTQVTRWNR